MRSKYYLIAAAATLLVACAQTDNFKDVDTSDVAIGFSDAYIGKITRATNAGEMTASNTNGTSSGTLCTVGNTMEVWGWKQNKDASYTQVFSQQTVTYTSSVVTGSGTPGTQWSYSPLKFWDRTASYKFYAVAPKYKADEQTVCFTMPNESVNEENTTTPVVKNDATKRLFRATGVPQVQVLMDNAGASKIKLANADANVTGTASTAIDYLVAGVVNCAAGAAYQGNDPTDKNVNFTFNHILSKLNVIVRTTDNFWVEANSNAGEGYPQIYLTDLTITLGGMCTQYDQYEAGSVQAAASDKDKWTVPVMDQTDASKYAYADYVCYDVDGTKVADRLRLQPKNTTTSYYGETVASYFVAPTATGLTSSSLDPATCVVTIKEIGYDIIYDGNNTETSSEHCVSENLVVAGLTSFVQNQINNLYVIVDPKAIYFDVQTVNDWTQTNSIGIEVPDNPSPAPQVP